MYGKNCVPHEKELSHKVSYNSSIFDTDMSINITKKSNVIMRPLVFNGGGKQWGRIWLLPIFDTNR